MHEESKRYLRFLWNDLCYQYNALPNGLSSAPRIFTRLLKVAFSVLRARGYTSVVYIDDSLLIGATAEECSDNVQATKRLLQDLGFYISFDKSVVLPTRQLQFLGFIIDSESMTVRLAKSKVNLIEQLSSDLIASGKAGTCIRTLARYIGVLIAALPAVRYGRLFVHALETAKIAALKVSKGNFDQMTILPPNVLSDVAWWKEHIPIVHGLIQVPETDIEVFTDASMEGWGAVYGCEEIGGRWTISDLDTFTHINVLELVAVLMMLKAFADKLQGKNVLLRCDNSCAVQYISHMGGTKSESCNAVTREIWLFCMDRHIWLHPSHIAGKLNVHADKMSRSFDDDKEWRLDPRVFQELVTEFGSPAIDLFASRANTQLDKYFSWKSDPGALAVDAFTIDWTKFPFVYAFPPFCILGRVIQKLRVARPDCLLIFPDWNTQPWYPMLQRMIVKRRRLPVMTLLLPGKPEATHPLGSKLNLVAGLLSRTC